jgi:hypothetical protein
MLLSLGRMAVVAIMLLLLLTALAGPALAQNGGGDNGGNTGGEDNGGNSGGDDNGGTNNVPEIDPSSAISGLTLLTAGILLLAERRRVKK